MDGGRNFGTKLAVSVVAAVPALLAVALVGEQPSWPRDAVALPLTLFSLALARLVRNTPWVWPERDPRLHARLSEEPGGEGLGVLLPGRPPELLGSALLASTFLTGGIVATTLAWDYRHALGADFRTWAGLGVVVSALGVWVGVTVAGAAKGPRTTAIILTPDGIVVSAPRSDRRLRWADLEAATLTHRRLRVLELVATGPYAWWDLRNQRSRDELDQLLVDGEPTELLLESMLDHPSVVGYAVRYYHAHPEDRAELADRRSLDRLRAVLDGPRYSDG